MSLADQAAGCRRALRRSHRSHRRLLARAAAGPWRSASQGPAAVGRAGTGRGAAAAWRPRPEPALAPVPATVGFWPLAPGANRFTGSAPVWVRRCCCCPAATPCCRPGWRAWRRRRPGFSWAVAQLGLVPTDGHFERRARLVELALAGVQHGQVVVGAQAARIVFGELGEGAMASAGCGLGLDHALEGSAFAGRAACQPNWSAFSVPRSACPQERISLRDITVVVGVRRRPR